MNKEIWILHLADKWLLSPKEVEQEYTKCLAWCQQQEYEMTFYRLDEWLHNHLRKWENPVLRAKVDWLKKNASTGKQMAYRLPLELPDLGKVVRVDGLEIPKELFPEEFDTIFEAYQTYLNKLENWYDETHKIT